MPPRANWFAENLALIMFATMFFIIFCGYPVAYVLGGTGLIFALIGWGLGEFSLVKLNSILLRMWGGVAVDPVLVSLPMFIFMGALLERSGVAKTCSTRPRYAASHAWRPLRRGHDMGTSSRAVGVSRCLVPPVSLISCAHAGGRTTSEVHRRSSLRRHFLASHSPSIIWWSWRMRTPRRACFARRRFGLSAVRPYRSISGPRLANTTGR